MVSQVCRDESPERRDGGARFGPPDVARIRWGIDRVLEEIGSDRFHGGVLYHRDGGLHPGKYHDGLVRVVLDAGAEIAPGTEVKYLRRGSNGFRVTTTRGDVEAGQVAICTNGYTGKATPWFRRRLVPIRSAMIATEELAPERMQRLMPTRRMYGDSRRVMAYYRPSPDGRRILFGGRAAGAGDRPDANARDLRRMLLDVFPELDETRISHVWSGLVAYTFDHAPHLGEQDGLFYAMGYCGSGVARSSFFGHKLGHKMLGNAEGATAFDDFLVHNLPRPSPRQRELATAPPPARPPTGHPPERSAWRRLRGACAPRRSPRSPPEPSGPRARRCAPRRRPDARGTRRRR